MVTYKKGDLWKAAILILVIGTVLWYSFRTVLRSARPEGAPRIATRAGTQPSGQQAAGTASEMFAPRAQGVGQLLVRAHAAPDPFRPYLSLLPATEAQAVAAASAPPPRTDAGEQAPKIEAAVLQLRLVGVVWGARPTAALVGGDGHHFARVGDSLPGGWRLAQIDQRGVVLTKGRERASLQLQKEPAPTSR
jgi:hypothetical protein